MRIIRSWPDREVDRPHVVDGLPRLVMRDYDYRCLGAIGDDVLLLEWDVAVDRDNLARFIQRIREAPDRVLVAPYRLYTTTARDVDLAKPVWAHRVYTGEHSTRHVTEADPECHLWALGMTYLPWSFLQRFLAAWPGHVSDGSLSGWHNRNVAPTVPIAWDVRPAHLHYPIERM